MLQEECKEKILSEEYRDFMMRDTGALGKNFPLENGCRIPLKYGFELFYIDQSEDRKKSLADYPYTMVPKCYTTLDMAAIQQAGIAAVQNIPGLELSGEGVLVGIIDTGINYLDPIFRNLDGSTRIQRIWDQEEQSGTAPREIGYGSEYTKEQINQAILSENPKETVPSFDTDGHGTFVASVACGGANPENLFIGAAPEAEMVIVKLKEAKEYLREYYFVDRDAGCYQENDLVAAVFYLQKVQEELKRPLVICLAVGTSFGGHGGYSILSEYLQNVAEYLNEEHFPRIVGRSVTLSALSISGKIILPMMKNEKQKKTIQKNMQNRNHLIAAARDGDEDAIENLTLEDMDTYSMLSRRIAYEDVLSIVDTCFMPYGVESDQYSVIGEILDYKKTVNKITEEEIYIMKIDTNGLVYDVCINKEDLLGEPQIGRRFKGNIWMQGCIRYMN